MVEPLNDLARLWWAWTASMFWQVGLLILLIGCIDLLTRKWAWPQLRYALWSLILVKLILPPSLSLPSSIVPEVQPRIAQAVRWLNSERPAGNKNPKTLANGGWRMAGLSLDRDPQFQRFANAENSLVEAEGLVRSGLSKAYEIAPDSVTTNATVVRQAIPDSNPQSETPSPQFQWQFYAMITWLLGTLILGTWLVLRLHSVAGRHAYRAAAASLPQSFYNHLADCATRLGLRRIPQVAVTRRLTSPAVFGIFRPVLLMPKGYLSKLSRRDTEHMLLHELAHIKRGDLVMHGLYMLLQIVYWYNPLLWLVRQQVHHLRELSCDGTVAELLRERTLAYRQTLLETARRLLATSAEPGLGLLGLFEDSNRLVVRLNWLTKPTWRYKTMKRVTVATIAALMFACVLPMAQGQEAAAPQVTTVVHDQTAPVSTEGANPQTEDRSLQEIAALQRQLEELALQQKVLQDQIKTLAEQRHQMMRARQEEAAAAVAGRQPRERAAGEPRRAPAEPRAGRGGGAPGTREEAAAAAREQAKQAVQEAERARQEGARARTEIRREIRRQPGWDTQMETWGEPIEPRERSPEVQSWQTDMEAWGKRMEQWGQELGRRMAAMAQPAGEAEAPAAAPMPPMPPMPARPARPRVETEVDVRVQPAPQPMPRPHAGGGVPHIAVPHIAPPHIEVPVVEPPAPPAVPEKQENQEEIVSRTEHTIDLTPGRVLDVKNEMGSIAVRGSDQPGCRLTITVKGRADTKEEAQAIVEQVKPVIQPSQDGVSVSMTKPEQGNQREHVNRVVTMELVVPRDAQLRLSQNFGNMQLADLNGSVRAVSNMGSIRTANVRGRVSLESNMGSIDYLAPRELSAKVQAKSQMGSIQSDLPLETGKSHGFSMGSKVSGTIGDGAGEVSLSTNMGSIRIRSQAPAPARIERSRRAVAPPAEEAF